MGSGELGIPPCRKLFKTEGFEGAQPKPAACLPAGRARRVKRGEEASDGGGAMLEYLSGQQLPGLTALVKEEK